MQIGTIKKELAAGHGHATGVDQPLFLVCPKYFVFLQIIGTQGVAKTVWHAILVVGTAEVTPTPAAKGTIALLGLRGRIWLATQKIKHVVLKDHPFPVTQYFCRLDHSLLLTRLGVQHQATIPVDHVERVVGRNKSGAMHQIPLRKFPTPELGAVVTVASNQRVEDVPLPPVMGNVPDGQKRTAPGGGRDRGHANIERPGQELGHVGCPNDLIGGDRVVVGSLFPVGPIVCPGKWRAKALNPATVVVCPGDDVNSTSVTSPLGKPLSVTRLVPRGNQRRATGTQYPHYFLHRQLGT